MNKDVLIIGIAGGSGSGKTFLAEALAKKLGPQKSFLLYQDNYYKDQSHKFDYDGGSVNFDHPDSIDFNLLANHLAELKKTRSIDIPLYDFETHSRSENTKHQEPKPVVIVDGILILSDKDVREQLDISVYVQTPEDIRYERRLQRDIKERGRTPEGVKNQFENQVKPMHDEFVFPSRKHADIITSGISMQEFQKNLDLLFDKLV